MLLMHLRQERAFGRLNSRDAALQEAQRWSKRNRDALWINFPGVNDDGPAPTNRISFLHEHPPVHRQPAADL